MVYITDTVIHIIFGVDNESSAYRRDGERHSGWGTRQRGGTTGTRRPAVVGVSLIRHGEGEAIRPVVVGRRGVGHVRRRSAQGPVCGWRHNRKPQVSGRRLDITPG